MNNEIKEILDKWKCYIGLTKKFSNNDMELLRVEDIERVLDYITNLQQENERLKERVAYLERSNNRREDTIIGLRFEVAEQEDYKSRCEKAIEYIKYNDDSLYTYEPDYDYEENLVDNYESSNFREDLLNILEMEKFDN